VSRLEISELVKGYDRQPVLEGVNLSVAAGSLSAVLGLSGCGKTTLLRVIAGFERPQRGSVLLGGRKLEGAGAYVPPEQRAIGYVPQEGALFPHLSVAANVGFGLSRAERRRGAVAELLELVGLSRLAKRYPHQLSGGEQQRVALARALARRPQLLLLDEPFSSLDAALRAHVREEVHSLLRSQGLTSVMVTHDQEEALSLADRVAILRDGRIVQEGSPAELYTRPLDARVARFIGTANLIDATFHAGAAKTRLGALPLRPGAPAPEDAGVVLVRPEQITVEPGEPVTSPGEDGRVPGIVLECRYYGHDALLQIELRERAAAQPLFARVHGSDALPAGTHVLVGARGPVTPVA
jgi:iron(III) transport system ATP-binding protein